METDPYEVEKFDGLISTLRKEFSAYGGAKIYVKEFEQGSPIETSFTVKIKCPNMEYLYSVSKDFEKIVRKEEGLVNVENSMDRSGLDFYLNINRDKASMLGVPVLFSLFARKG